MSNTRNDSAWREAASAYIKTKHALDDAKQAEQEARLTLIEMTDTDTRGAGVSVKYTERKGQIDYKLALKDIAPGVDIEPYRKRSTSVTSITISDNQE